MPVLTISSFASLAGLMLAARKLATDPDPLNRMKALADLAKDGRALAAVLRDSGLSPLVAEMTRRAEDADRAFAHDGPGKEDARAVFWQVAPAALGDGAVLAGAGLEADVATEAMVAAIRGSGAGPDFARTVLAEAYFRAVAGPVLEVMLDRADFVAGIAPDLWRESLRRQGSAVEMLARVEATGLRTEAKLDAHSAEAAAHRAETARQTEMLRQMQAQLATMASAQVARASGVTDAALIWQARRIAADVADAETAFRELANAVDIAIRVQEEARAGANLGDFVDAVLVRVAERSALGEHAAAVEEIEAGLAREEAESRARQVRLLDAALEQDLLRRDPEAAARRLVRKTELQLPEGGSLFDALQKVSKAWYINGRDKGLSLHLEVAIGVSLQRQALASNPDALGAVLNDIGNGFFALGKLERRNDKLKKAYEAYETTLEQWTRDRVPLNWAGTKNNIGNTMLEIGRRTGEASFLSKALECYQDALRECSRNRAPALWAMAKNNEGNALAALGERELGKERLEQAIEAYRCALLVRQRRRAPLDWAATQNNNCLSLSLSR
jgi:tetratricopeptide (TPR) repeat protein